MGMMAPLNASTRLARITQSQGDETLRNAVIARKRDAKRAMRPMISTWSAKPSAQASKGSAPHWMASLTAAMTIQTTSLHFTSENSV